MTDVAQEALVQAQRAEAPPDELDALVPPVPRQFQIVPVRGLIPVALVLGGLIATIATNALWSLDFFHVVGGGIWTTLDLFLGFVLGPILGRLSIPARIELTTRLMPKLILIMPTAVVCTLAAGFQLARHLGYL